MLQASDEQTMYANWNSCHLHYVQSWMWLSVDNTAAGTIQTGLALTLYMAAPMAAPMERIMPSRLPGENPSLYMNRTTPPTAKVTDIIYGVNKGERIYTGQCCTRASGHTQGGGGGVQGGSTEPPFVQTLN